MEAQFDYQHFGYLYTKIGDKIVRARCRGVGACAVTFTVGGLSVINAIAGAYSESLPVICLVGGPNSNDYGTNHILHHTIGETDFSQEFRCFKEVTCAQVKPNDATSEIHWKKKTQKTLVMKHLWKCKWKLSRTQMMVCPKFWVDSCIYLLLMLYTHCQELMKFIQLGSHGPARHC
jgi:hypothetical protein